MRWRKQVSDATSVRTHAEVRGTETRGASLDLVEDRAGRQRLCCSAKDRTEFEVRVHLVIDLDQLSHFLERVEMVPIGTRNACTVDRYGHCSSSRFGPPLGPALPVARGGRVLGQTSQSTGTERLRGDSGGPCQRGTGRPRVRSRGGPGPGSPSG